MDDSKLVRYAKQILMPDVGCDGQERLHKSTVLIVGAGGLGCSVAQYLAGSGVGRLVLVDNDVVEQSNLPRQILFDERDVGQPKVERLAEKLRYRTPDTTVEVINQSFSPELLAKYARKGCEDGIDVVVDAGDNLLLSHQLDDWALMADCPLVHASVSRFEGHCYVCLPENSTGEKKFPRLKSLFPSPENIQTCSQTGVLTVAVGLIASYQACQVVRVLLAPALGDIIPEIIVFDGKTMRFSSLSVS